MDQVGRNTLIQQRNALADALSEAHADRLWAWYHQGIEHPNGTWATGGMADAEGLVEILGLDTARASWAIEDVRSAIRRHVRDFPATIIARAVAAPETGHSTPGDP